MKKAFTLVFTALILSTFCLTSCSKDDNKNSEPTQSNGKAHYTVMVYGTVGGQMDYILEDTWEKLKPLLTDSTNVRMVFLYKYGRAADFSGHYADPGDVVFFELNSQTDFNKLREKAVNNPNFLLYKPESLAGFIDTCKALCPADNYIFLTYGHGGAFDITNDYPDIPVTKGILYDEQVGGRGMSMYELADGLAAADIDRFKCIFLHNCLLGNIENLTQMQPYADYFYACAHVLASDGTVIVEFIKALLNKSNSDFEQVSNQLFDAITPFYSNLNETEDEPLEQNLDMKIIRSSYISTLNNSLNQLRERLIALYPTKKEEIDLAADQIYRYDTGFPYLIDIETYAKHLAHATEDPTIEAISNDIHNTFENMFVRNLANNYADAYLDNYTLSIVFGHNSFYNCSVHGHTVASSYAPSVFNNLTHWGDWLNTNTYWPTTTTANTGIAEISWEGYKTRLH